MAGKKAAIIIAVLLAALAAFAGCGSGDTYASKDTGASVNLFDRTAGTTNPGLAGLLGQPVEIFLRSELDSGLTDVSGYVVYRKALAEGDSFDALDIKLREDVDEFNKNTVNGGKLTKDDFKAGYRLVYVQGTERKEAAVGGVPGEYVYTRLAFSSLKNLNSSYVVRTVDSVVIKENPPQQNIEYTKLKDNSGEVFNLRSVQSDEKLAKKMLALELNIPSGAWTDELTVRMQGTVVGHYIENYSAKLPADGSSLAFESAISGKLYLIYNPGNPYLVTIIIIVGASVLATAFLALSVIRLTVYRKKK